MKTYLRLLAIVLGAFGACSAIAAGDALPGDRYVFGVFGQARATDISKSENDAALRAAGATNLTSTVNDTASSLKLGLGFKIASRAAIEISYIKAGEFKYNARFTQGTATDKISATGYGLSLVGFSPLGATVSAYGHVGVYRFTLDETATVTATGVASASQTASSVSPGLGAGIDFALTPTMKVRVEYTFYSKVGDENKTGTSDVHAYSAGIAFGF